jgi:hypothetical protein
MKILVFSPFSAIWRHSILETRLIQVISSSKKFEVVSVGCGGLFPMDCSARNYLRRGDVFSLENSKEGCKKCCQSREIITDFIPAKKLNLIDFSNDSDLAAIEDLVQNFDVADALKFSFKHLPIGERALFEVVLKYKKRTLKLNTEEYEEWKSVVSNMMLLVTPAMRILDQEKPDAVVTFNAQYGIPGIFAEIAIKMGIKTYSMSGSVSPNEISGAISIWDWEKYKTQNPALFEWPGVQKIRSLNPEEIRRYSRHRAYIETGLSPWTYSQKKMNRSTYEAFNIKKSHKIVLAVVSSEDEIFASRVAGLLPLHRTQSSVFKSQLEWIDFLIKHYADNSDTHLIIRLHPREFPNKRENQISEQSDVWAAYFRDLPDNVHLDHPKNGFSLYDHFNHITMLTTGWSSSGVEALSYGIPVVTYDQNLLGYPTEALLSGLTVQEYKDNLKVALNEDRGPQGSDFAAKWTNFSIFQNSIYVGGGLQDAHLNSTNAIYTLFFRGLNRFLNTLAPAKVKYFDLRLPRLKSDDKKLLRLLLNKKDSIYQV